MPRKEEALGEQDSWEDGKLPTGTPKWAPQASRSLYTVVWGIMRAAWASEHSGVYPSMGGVMYKPGLAYTIRTRSGL